MGASGLRSGRRSRKGGEATARSDPTDPSDPSDPTEGLRRLRTFPDRRPIRQKYMHALELELRVDDLPLFEIAYTIDTRDQTRAIGRRWRQCEIGERFMPQALRVQNLTAKIAGSRRRLITDRHVLGSNADLNLRVRPAVDSPR